MMLLSSTDFLPSRQLSTEMTPEIERGKENIRSDHL